MKDFVRGIDKAQKKLQQLSDNLKALEGTHNVSFGELFPDSFIRAHTNTNTLSEFFEQSGFDTSSTEAFKAIPDDDMDRYVSQNSNFNSWEEMLHEATRSYVQKKLEL